MNDYTADNIVILPMAEVAERFSWAKVEQLAQQYNRPNSWIANGLKACERAGVPDDYFIDRYLRKQPIPMREDVNEAMRELWKEENRMDLGA